VAWIFTHGNAGRTHFYGQDGDEVWRNLDEGGKKLIRDFRFRSCGSVEHINPQKTMDAATCAEPDHSIGNLALISGSRNAKFSNNPPDGKKAIILQSYAESLKMLHFLWCDSDAQKEGDVMHKILLKATLIDTSLVHA